MPISEVFNIDCMEYMREIPNGFFDLAVVDPPYGDGLGGGNPKRFGGMFRASIDGSPTRGGGAALDHLHSSRRKDERAAAQIRAAIRQVQTAGERVASSDGGGHFDRYKRPPEEWQQTGLPSGGAGRSDSTPTKKSLRGTSPQGRTTFASSSASHAIKLSGAGTISTCRRRAASASFGRPISRRKAFLWHRSSMPGRRSTETPC